MNGVTDEVVEEALMAFFDEVLWQNAVGSPKQAKRDMRRALEAALSALSLPSSEAGEQPVAWQYRTRFDVGGKECVTDWKPCDKTEAGFYAARPYYPQEVRPLYTRPAASALPSSESGDNDAVAWEVTNRNGVTICPKSDPRFSLAECLALGMIVRPLVYGDTRPAPSPAPSSEAGSLDDLAGRIGNLLVIGEDQADARQAIVRELCQMARPAPSPAGLGDEGPSDHCRLNGCEHRKAGFPAWAAPPLAAATVGLTDGDFPAEALKLLVPVAEQLRGLAQSHSAKDAKLRACALTVDSVCAGLHALATRPPAAAVQGEK